MIKDFKYFEKFEKKFISGQKPDYEKALAIFEAMWEEFRQTKAFNAKNRMEGVQADIQLARILNNVQKTNK